MKMDDTQGVREPGVHVTKRPQAKPRTKTVKEHVHKNMTMHQILERHPQAASIMAEYGLHCFGCSANDLETLEEGCLGHGFSDHDVENLIFDINEMVDELPPRPQTLTITESAATHIGMIAKAEGKENDGLSVLADEHGGFFMEFRTEPDRGDKIFRNDNVPTVQIFASLLTLQRIGGATIDFRDERFKLDLPEDAAKSGCACGGNCSCKK